MSYREIGQRLDLTRPAVESALFRARRRLESEYSELSEGRRCEAMGRRSRASPRASSAARRSTGSRVTRAAATAAAAAPASLGSSRCRRSARCARRQPRCCRCHGCCAARAETAVGSRDSSERARTRPRWRSALRLWWPWRHWPARAARCSARERFRGTARRAGRTASRSSAPRQGRGEPQRGATGPATDGEREGARRASGQRDSGHGGGPRRRFDGHRRCAEQDRAGSGTRRRSAPTGDGSAPSLEGSAPEPAGGSGHGRRIELARASARDLGARAARSSSGAHGRAAASCRRSRCPRCSCRASTT